MNDAERLADRYFQRVSVLSTSEGRSAAEKHLERIVAYSRTRYGTEKTLEREKRRFRDRHGVSPDRLAEEAGVEL